MKSIIGIFGVPRTGTSWLGEILNSSPEVVYKFQPLFSYAFKNYLNVYSTKEEVKNFFDKLENTNDDFLDCVYMRTKGFYPVFDKEEAKMLAFKEVRYLYLIPHLLEIIPNIKIIMVVRNCIDTLTSWINAPKEYKKEWDIYNEWYFAQSKNEYKPENYYGYAKWKEARMLFAEMKRIYPEKTIIVEYEKLFEDSLYETKRLYEFCELEMGKQTRNFIRDSQKNTIEDAYGVYREKEKEKKYKAYLPDSIINMINEDLEIMSRFGNI
jgi:hypothetical protein